MDGTTPLGARLPIAPDVTAAPPSALGDSHSKIAPSFHALLEQLQDRARVLSQDTARVNHPEQIPGVVADAQSSLEAARSLSERMLEAYRQQAFG